MRQFCWTFFLELVNLRISFFVVAVVDLVCYNDCHFDKVLGRVDLL